MTDVYKRQAMGFLRLDDISGTADLGNAVAVSYTHLCRVTRRSRYEGNIAEWCY